jgi:hypothetical protein
MLTLPSTLRMTPRQAGALAVIWLILALFFGVLYRFADSAEHHAYNAGATPPSTVTLTQGKHYQLSTAGGQAALSAAGQQVSAADCKYQLGDLPAENLGATALADDSGATHMVATFVAPVSGAVRITCAGIGAVFVDDANDSALDLGLVFVLISSLLASCGVVFGIWALYASSGHSSSDPNDRPDQVDYRGSTDIDQPVDNSGADSAI